MELKLSITQTAKLLGITTDAIRFYEKEGLIKPKREPHSNYRYYEWEYIRLLIFIAFYRKLDVSIPEIKLLLTSYTFEDINNTFEELIEHNRKLIEQLSNKIERLESHRLSISYLSANTDKFSVDTMPHGYKMIEDFNADTEYKKIAPLLSDPIFSYGNIAYKNYFDEAGTSLRYMSYIIWDKLIEAAPLKKPISEYPVLESCECVCTSTTGHENGIIDIDIKTFTDYCSQHNYEHYGYYYAFYSYSVPDKDKIVDYYKLYFPIKKYLTLV